ncbi:MAG: CmcJ/NvfI family oxidoreductase [Rhodospirillales bacterium]
MSSLAEQDLPQSHRGFAGGQSTRGQIRYLASHDERPIIHVPAEGGEELRRRSARYADHSVAITDLRPLAKALTLDDDAIVLRQSPTAVADLYDDQAVERDYYAEVEALLTAETGAARVVTFDHTRRFEADPGAAGPAERSAVRSVHNDYTDRSAPQRVRDLLGEEAEALLTKRFAIANTWRPIRGPVLRAPLGFLHPDSLAPENLIAAELRYPDRSGEIYEIAYAPQHRWLYVPKMQREELLVFKCYDSARDGRARFLPHTAFDDISTLSGAPPRESIETRSLLFFD